MLQPIYHWFRSVVVEPIILLLTALISRFIIFMLLYLNEKMPTSFDYFVVLLKFNGD